MHIDADRLIVNVSIPSPDGTSFGAAMLMIATGQALTEAYERVAKRCQELGLTIKRPRKTRRKKKRRKLSHG